MAAVMNVTGMMDLQTAVMACPDGHPIAVCCSATWCGPCKMIAPLYEQLAGANRGKMLFVKAMEGSANDVISNMQVRGFPTFVFGVKRGNEFVEQSRFSGADPGRLQSTVADMVAKAAPASAFEGSGRALGGSGDPASSREARIAALERSVQTSSTPADPPAPSSSSSSDDVVLPNVRALMDMGFSAAVAGLALSKAGSVEAAVDWVAANPEAVEGAEAQAAIAASQQQPTQTTASASSSSSSGGGGGAAPLTPEHAAATVAGILAAAASAQSTHDPPLVRNNSLVSAASTFGDEDLTIKEEEEEEEEAGGSASSSSLSLEEKKALVQQKLAAKRAAKAEADRLAAREREVRRREDGKKAKVTAEALEEAARQKAREERRREAALKAAHKTRVRIQLLQDKLERFRSAGREEEAQEVMREIEAVRSGKSTGAAGGAAAAAVGVDVWERRQEAALGSILRAEELFRGRARPALKTVRALVGNALSPERGGQPGDAGARFRRIRSENAAFKGRVADVPGARLLLQAAGWGSELYADAADRGLRGPAAVEAYVFGGAPFSAGDADHLARAALQRIDRTLASLPAAK